jgi:heme/copper-type cytochrome/quinol oxidase subunit 2
MILVPALGLNARRLLIVLWLLAGGFGGSALAAESATLEPDKDGVQRATIELDDYYTPRHLVVQAGKPVELVLKSLTAVTPHNFIVDDPAAGFKVNQEVGSGKTETVRFTPTKPGTFVFYCDKKLLFFKSHREKGMEGRLEVR